MATNRTISSVVSQTQEEPQRKFRTSEQKKKNRIENRKLETNFYRTFSGNTFNEQIKSVKQIRVQWECVWQHELAVARWRCLRSFFFVLLCFAQITSNSCDWSSGSHSRHAVVCLCARIWLDIHFRIRHCILSFIFHIFILFSWLSEFETFVFKSNVSYYSHFQRILVLVELVIDSSIRRDASYCWKETFVM